MNSKVINEQIKQRTEETSDGNCGHADELNKMREILEKAKEFKSTSELKVKKMKQQHLEEINEVKIQNIRFQEELRFTVNEKQRLQESERILLNTFDTLKTYYEKAVSQKDTLTHQQLKTLLLMEGCLPMLAFSDPFQNFHKYNCTLVNK